MPPAGPLFLAEGDEFLPQCGIAFHAAAQDAGCREGCVRANAPCAHAGVGGPDDDTGAPGLEVLHEGVGHLRGQAFLHLQAAAEDVNEAGKLGQARDAAVGDVSDVGRSDDVGEVVFAF